MDKATCKDCFYFQYLTKYCDEENSYIRNYDICNKFQAMEELEDIYKDNNVEHPKHYNQGKYEVIDVIRDWKLGFNLGNVIKYVARAEHKGNFREDLEKAIFYLEDELNNLGDSDVVD